MTELKKCPFCGSNPEHSVWSDHNYNRAECEECDYSFDYFHSFDELAAAWNRRAESEPSKAGGWTDEQISLYFRKQGWEVLPIQTFPELGEAVRAILSANVEQTKREDGISIKGRLRSAARNAVNRDLLLNALDYIEALEKIVQRYRDEAEKRMDADLLLALRQITGSIVPHEDGEWGREVLAIANRALEVHRPAAPPSAQTVAQERELFRQFARKELSVYWSEGAEIPSSMLSLWKVWQARAALAAPAQLSDEQILQKADDFGIDYDGSFYRNPDEDKANLLEFARALLSAAQGKESGNG